MKLQRMCSGIPAIINFLERPVRLRKGIQAIREGSSVESKSSTTLGRPIHSNPSTAQQRTFTTTPLSYLCAMPNRPHPSKTPRLVACNNEHHRPRQQAVLLLREID